MFEEKKASKFLAGFVDTLVNPEKYERKERRRNKRAFRHAFIKLFRTLKLDIEILLKKGEKINDILNKKRTGIGSDFGNNITSYQQNLKEGRSHQAMTHLGSAFALIAISFYEIANSKEDINNDTTEYFRGTIIYELNKITGEKELLAKMSVSLREYIDHLFQEHKDMTPKNKAFLKLMRP